MVPRDGRPCSFNGCDKTADTGGLCVGHYHQRIKGRELTPLWSPERSRKAFWEQVKKTSGCWLWTGRVINSGYGQVSIEGRKWLPHRYSYTAAYGDIPDGKFIDHRCRNKLCVRPDHLRPVSNTQNLRAQGLRTNNTSGVRGVSWDKARGRWSAKVKIGGKLAWSQRYDTLEEAAHGVAEARAKLYSEGDL